MMPCWTEVNAAILAVLGEYGRASCPEGRPSSLASAGDVFVERLFALRHAEAVGEVDEVRVLAGTVVTPLALDWLRRNRIGLRFVSVKEAGPARARQSGEWGFAVESRSGQVEAIRRMLLDDWIEIGPDATEAARWVVEGDHRGAFVLADEASVAAWRANRVQGVRAATVAEPEAVTRAIRHLGANLIVVEPPGKSIYLLKQVGERFRRAGAPVSPTGFEVEAPR